MTIPKRKAKEFFTEGGMFKPNQMAAAMSYNVGVGPDNQFWTYQTEPTHIDSRVGVWISDPEVIDRRVANVLKDRYMLSRGSTVERLVRHFHFVPRLTADEPQPWERTINLANGSYDWRDDLRTEHDPHDYSVVQLPIDHDPDAECPTFDEWMRDVVPEDAHALVWEVMGYILMSGNPLQTAVLLLGQEGTGKSTFLRVIERMLGRRNISAESLRSLTENRFAAASLYGKAANIVGDIDAAYMNDTSLFLQITGGDTMSAERKNQHAFEFRPYAVPIFSTNKVWQSANTSGAYFRRWTVLPFDRKVDRSKPFNEEALYAEIPGIFNRAMSALRNLYNRTRLNTATGDEEPFRYFEVQGSAREARERFARDSDPIREWLDEDELITHDAGNGSLRTSRTTVYARYSSWCATNGIRRPKSGPELYKALRALGFTEVKSHGTQTFVGIDVWIPGTVPA